MAPPKTTTITLRAGGTLKLPAAFLAKYDLRAGKVLTLVDLDGTILLQPSVPLVSRLAAELERLRKERASPSRTAVTG